MTIWFIMIGTLGAVELFKHPEVLEALNPWYGINLLVNYPGGFWLLGAVFLCTTGLKPCIPTSVTVANRISELGWSFVIFVFVAELSWPVGMAHAARRCFPRCRCQSVL